MLSQVGCFCGPYTQEIEHFRGEDELYSVIVFTIRQKLIKQLHSFKTSFIFSYNTGVGDHA